MTKEEFLIEIQQVIENRPIWARKGQAVFNHVDEKYGVARTAQYSHGKDCFYNDTYIPDFVECCWQLIEDRKQAMEP